MKKFLLTFLTAFASLMVLAQLNPPPVTFSTTTGIVPGGNIATCSFSPGTPNSCIHVCRNSVVVTGDAVSMDPRSIRFNYYQVTNGAKSLHVIIQCGTDIIINDCIDASGDASNTLVYKEYPGIVCNFKATIVIKIQAHTNGNCGGTECGPLLISTAGSPLPVTFKSLTATRNNSNVLIRWETAAESNSEGFAIERNDNDGVWEEVGYVSSQAIGGFSDHELSYSYIDQNNVKGMTQYRIRQVDKDGKFKFSEVKSVRGENQPIKLTVYPNPSTDGNVHIAFDDAMAVRNVTVLDMSGRVVRQIIGITNNNITIENLMPGMYTIRVVVPETGAQGVEKIIVNKR